MQRWRVAKLVTDFSGCSHLSRVYALRAESSEAAAMSAFGLRAVTNGTRSPNVQVENSMTSRRAMMRLPGSQGSISSHCSRLIQTCHRFSPRRRLSTHIERHGLVSGGFVAHMHFNGDKKYPILNPRAIRRLTDAIRSLDAEREIRALFLR
jgi:hypothetical protein